MAKTIMIQGTASNAGKSLIVAGLCRIFKQDGYKVAPFKSQNMALNSFITKDGFEMGRAQVMQAEAAGIEPDVRMNPILLKPTSDTGSQVIVNGEVVGDMSAKDYFAQKKKLIPDIMKAFNELAEENDIIVIEGAGSPAEINLNDDDIVNMGMAKLAQAPVFIVGDIDRGGVFASLAGTMLFLKEDEKNMVKGTIINKFRGDKSILEPGLKMLEDAINVPVTGVVPYLNIDVDDEDSLTERFNVREEIALIDIAVIRLPRISNFTDFNALEYIDGVSVRYVGSVKELKNPDLIILPGTKNTISDLIWLRECGLEASIMKHVSKNKPLFGICGGYQMLGLTLKDPHNVEYGGEISGLGLLSCETIFEKEKTRVRVEGKLEKVSGVFSSLSDVVFEGYEIHMGDTTNNKNIVNEGNVYGTYIHGIFDKETVSKEIIETLLELKGLSSENIKTFNMKEYKESQYDILANSLRESLDLEYIYKVIGEKEN
ncbi:MULTISPECIES: cobyric acid synthase [Clostridium]|uniref:cobyric acid synthase n=1 Tax=Clostridium TaxID=1485 RepID=UPI0002CBEE88|nr:MULTISPECIES: cobyric acid synthase [Clostridium]EMU52136.1 cobyric acid synthase CobQ [Clostridium butyricum DKU-01]POO85950.1 cobyric acid synthase [Clostridium sp. 3-3]RQN02635.1 cobyric acid synthase [Clostridium butyricum]